MSRFFSQSLPVDEFRHIVSNMLRPFSIRPRNGGTCEPFVQRAEINRFPLAIIRLGDPVDIYADPQDRFFMLQVTLSGVYTATGRNGRALDFGPGSAQLVDPRVPLSMSWGENCRQLVVRLDCEVVAQMAELLGCRNCLVEPTEAIDLSTPEGAALKRFLRFIIAELERDAPLSGDSMLGRQTEQSLFAYLMAAIRNTSRGIEIDKRIVSKPYYVKRAEEFIADNLTTDIGILDIAEYANVSARTLFRGFRSCREMSPLAWLRSLRLERAHADLLAADPRVTTVTEIAHKWGFTHLGEFSHRYRRGYGATPSQTLRNTHS